MSSTLDATFRCEDVDDSIRRRGRIQPWFKAIQPARIQPWFDAIQPWSYANDTDDDGDDDDESGATESGATVVFLLVYLCSCIDQWMWVNKLPKFHVKSVPKHK